MKRSLIDTLLLLAAMAIVLLTFGILLSVRPKAAQDAEAATVEPAPLPSDDVVVLTIAPESTATPEPSSTPAPDKPAYDPAIPLPEDLRLILRDACAENGVDLALVLGVIEVESCFIVDADNGSDYGLMQLNRRFFPEDLPAGENIRVGVEHLGQLLARYGDVEAALTAYNAGEDTGSRDYADAVLTAAEKWRDILWTE